MDSGKSSSSEELGLLATIGVFYRCPRLGPDILPKSEWISRIKSYIQKQIDKDGVIGSCLMIHTLNSNEKVSGCIELLCTYLKNILAHPKDDKFKMIVMSNKTFSEKVKNVKGALEFLMTAGFKHRVIKNTQSTEECLVFENKIDASYLEYLIRSLHTVKPIHLELDRNPGVFQADRTKIEDTPDDFFKLTVDEVKSEQKKRSESIKASSRLMTKAMRESEEKKTKTKVKMYPYSLIRIRFPNGVYLQGTFESNEPLLEVRKFVSDCLAVQTPFELVSSLGKSFSEKDYNTSIQKLDLVPAVVLNIHIKLPVNKSIIRSDLVSKMRKL